MRSFHFNFLSARKLTAILSLSLILISIVALAVKGLAFGLDFTGGTLVEVRYEQAADLAQIRSTLSASGYEEAVVQYYGADTAVMIRLPDSFNPSLGNEVVAALSASQGSEVQLERAEFVGAQVGEELREQGGLGTLLALGAVMLYVTFRFQLKFAAGAVVALIHDVIITLGFFSLFQWTVDLTVLAAILAVIGYSINDTIVVFDRIRENMRQMRKTETNELINSSLNQTLARTLATSLTTLLVLVALWLFGGATNAGFALALIIGVSVGTYSSIFVASSLLIFFKLERADLIPPVLEGEQDSAP